MNNILVLSSIDNTKEKRIKDVLFVKEYVFMIKDDLNVDDRKDSDDEYQEIGRYLKGYHQNTIDFT